MQSLLTEADRKESEPESHVRTIPFCPKLAVVLLRLPFSRPFSSQQVLPACDTEAPKRLSFLYIALIRPARAMPVRGHCEQPPHWAVVHSSASLSGAGTQPKGCIMRWSGSSLTTCSFCCQSTMTISSYPPQSQ